MPTNDLIERTMHALLNDFACCSCCKQSHPTYDNPYGCYEREHQMEVAENAHDIIMQLESENMRLKIENGKLSDKCAQLAKDVSALKSELGWLKYPDAMGK